MLILWGIIIYIILHIYPLLVAAYKEEEWVNMVINEIARL